MLEFPLMMYYMKNGQLSYEVAIDEQQKAVWDKKGYVLEPGKAIDPTLLTALETKEQPVSLKRGPGRPPRSQNGMD